MWSTWLTTGVELAGRRRDGRLICPLVAWVAAGAGGLWAAWKARQRESRPAKQNAGKEAPANAEEKAEE